MNVNQLSALAKLISSNPNEAKALLKLVSVEVLGKLPQGNYSIDVDGQKLTAQSQKQLSEGMRYWAQMTQSKSALPQLSKLVKMPQLVQHLQHLPLDFSLKDIQTLLHAKKPQTTMQQMLLQELNNASTKEEFSSLSTLLLSLGHNVLSIPLRYQNYYALLQIKKRYNNKTKKTQIDFYAALEFLGPIGGVILLDRDEIKVKLSVAFERTKHFLEDDMNNFTHSITIVLQESIEPLYELDNPNSLLDIRL